MWTQRIGRLVASLACAALAGCASYAVPGRGAELQAFGVSREQQTDASVAASMDKRPLASFPTAVAVARVQAPGYRSDTTSTWGSGRYCVVTTRDVEPDDAIQRLQKLPMVSGVAPVNRLLLPPALNSDLELRGAAAALHADVLLIYTIDTVFEVEDEAAPLTVVSLGLSPNQQARVLSTASAAFLDTRNGYVYGVAEATERGSQLTSAWTSAAAADQARRRTESAAFEKLVGELEKTWGGIVRGRTVPTM